MLRADAGIFVVAGRNFRARKKPTSKQLLAPEEEGGQGGEVNAASQGLLDENVGGQQPRIEHLFVAAALPPRTATVIVSAYSRFSFWRLSEREQLFNDEAALQDMDLG